MERCINIDWLEVYCLEPHGLRRDAEYFIQQGWEVQQRDYGTRVYEEMFTLMDYRDGQPLIEIRRKPKGNKTTTGVYVIDPDSCHIRLCNRTCYFEGAAKLMDDFLMRYQYSFMRISRIDLCLDFIRFDSGDDPAKFVKRYLKGKFSKINQANITAHGQDWWDGREWNSLSWGSKKSMIQTKLYCKSLELKERKDKPYIRQAWALSGLVDNFITLERTKADGTNYKPAIWRLEFTISSSVKKWAVIEDVHTSKKKIRSIHNTLDCYYTKAQMLNVFASLAYHYFFFKKFEKDCRKDRCQDKILWKFNSEVDTFYKVENVASSKPVSQAWENLKQKLKEYQLTTTNEDARKACDVLINDLERWQIQEAAAQPWNANELTLLRLLISKRVKNHNNPLSEDVNVIQSMLQMSEGFFGEKTSEKKAVQ